MRAALALAGLLLASPVAAEAWVQGPTPLFRWGSGGAVLTVAAIDVTPVQIVWQGRAIDGRIDYAGPPLIHGARYFVEARLANGRTLGAVFAIDPGLAIPSREVAITATGDLGRIVAATRALPP
jgi:hypothetical protein